MGLLDGKIAIVTGGGGEIGRAEALLFAAEGAGVVVADLGTASDGTGSDPRVAERVANEIEQRGGQALPCAADVTSSEGADTVVRATIERFGRVDILVNSAGIAIDRPMLSMSGQEWERVLAVHLTGSFWCTQRVARQLIEQGQGGRIVLTTSAAGLWGTGGQANYGAAKAGVFGLMRAAAVELEPHGITVNAVAPVARTRLTKAQPQLEGLEELTPNHVAPAALFLASELCGARSGTVLGVAAGRLYRFEFVESRGRYKEADKPWTAAEIAEHWDALGRLP